jgi:hypothetical protein
MFVSGPANRPQVLFSGSWWVFLSSAVLPEKPGPLEQDSLLYHALVAWQGIDAKSNLFKVFNFYLKSD